MKVGGEAGEGFGGWCEAMAGAGSSGFELCGGKDAHGAGVAAGEILLEKDGAGGGDAGARREEGIA